MLTLPNDLQIADQFALSVHLQDLEAVQRGVEKFALVSQTGSALEKEVANLRRSVILPRNRMDIPCQTKSN